MESSLIGPFESNKPVGEPMTVSVAAGIITKRVNSEPTESPFELKLNVTNTELVVVEDASQLDSNAVILKVRTIKCLQLNLLKYDFVLKSTAVLTYKPTNSDRPLNCNLQSLEVFSCCLASEEETALSIIDPTTISFELIGKMMPHHHDSQSTGLMEVQKRIEPVLEVSINSLNIRLSYNDSKLFLAILKSLPKQAQSIVTSKSNKQVVQSKSSQSVIDQEGKEFKSH